MFCRCLPHVLLQRNAVVRALSARDYLCLQGMPGTGKTTTIAVIVRALVARGQSVLITSHTNSAVDTVLRKVRSMSGLGSPGLASVLLTHFLLHRPNICGQLVEAGLDVLRVGNVEKVHVDLRQHTLGPAIESLAISGVAALSDRLATVRAAYQAVALCATCPPLLC